VSVHIERVEDGNWREREDRRTGRVRIAKSAVVKWLVIEDDTTIEAFDRLKDAKAKYPKAKVSRT
jgi:hypothetical protein